MRSAARVFPRLFQAILAAALVGAFLFLVSIYHDGLRDPRYFDGWVLAGGMGLQLAFHAAIKSAKLSPRSILRWRKFHILVGYFLIAAFLSHSSFSLPDTGFEWVLWLGFVFVSLSGIFGTYLAWSLREKGGLDDGIGYDRIPIRIAELARDVQAISVTPNPPFSVIALPEAPYDTWIIDLYTNHLRDFFGGHRNFASHLVGSRRAIKPLTDEIDSLLRYVDESGKTKLAVIRNLVIEKDRLDFARIHFALTKGWLLVHVPVTYGLIVLSIFHVLVVYSFSSGAW
jgi:hypothetical protein